MVSATTRLFVSVSVNVFSSRDQEKKQLLSVNGIVLTYFLPSNAKIGQSIVHLRSFHSTFVDYHYSIQRNRQIIQSYVLLLTSSSSHSPRHLDWIWSILISPENEAQDRSVYCPSEWSSFDALSFT